MGQEQAIPPVSYIPDRISHDNVLLHQDLTRAAHALPDVTALVGQQNGTESVRLTYAQLARRTEAVAAGLSQLGLGAGDVLAVQLPNWTEAVILTYAASRLGALICPITTIYRQRELRFVLAQTESRIVVVPRIYRGFDYCQMIASLRADLPGLEHALVVGDVSDRSEVPFEQLVTQETACLPDLAAQTARDPVMLAFTSGTTGEPKGVMHSHDSLHAVIRGFVDHVELHDKPRSLVVSPIGHLTGMIWGCLTTIMLRGTVVLQEWWQPTRAADLIEEHEVTLIAGATPFLRDLISLARFQPDTSPLKTFICAGAPIPPQLVSAARESLGCQVIPAWGMSEYPIGTAVAPSSERLASVSDGDPCGGVEIRIQDGDHPASVGVDGDLEIRGPGLFMGYYKRPEFDQQSKTADGFLKTGDRARYINAEQFIRITGRSKDLIIRGGENIPVVEIENLLLTHPDIADVALVAQPDDRLGEIACAFLVMRRGADPIGLPDIDSHLTACQIARQFIPERVIIIEALPRTMSGKTQKFELARLIAAAE